jgi:hypothetical protein
MTDLNLQWLELLLFVQVKKFATAREGDGKIRVHRPDPMHRVGGNSFRTNPVCNRTFSLGELSPVSFTAVARTRTRAPGGEGV